MHGVINRGPAAGSWGRQLPIVHPPSIQSPDPGVARGQTSLFGLETDANTWIHTLSVLCDDRMNRLFSN